MKWKKEIDKYFWWFIGLYCVYIFCVDQTLSFFQTIVSIVAFFLSSYFNIYVHEFGHAIVGWLAGFEIEKILIGTGNNIYKLKIINTNTDLYINRNPFGGLTYPSKFSKKHFRLKYLFFCLGGIISEIILITILSFYIFFYSNRGTINSDSNFKYIIIIILMVIFTSILNVLANIFPYNTYLNGEYIPNDGLQFWQTITMSEKSVTNIAFSIEMNQAYKKIQEKKFSETERICRECLQIEPDLPLISIYLSSAFINQLKIHEAIDILIRLMENKELENHEKVYVYCYLSYCYLVQSIDDKKILKKANLRSQQAYELDSESHVSRVIRAFILIEIGDYLKGTQILENLFITDQMEDQENQRKYTIEYLYLAYGYYLQEKWSESQKYWLLTQENISLLTPDEEKILEHMIEQTNNFSLLS